MLGSLYENAWDLDRSTLALPHSNTALHPRSKPKHSHQRTTHSNPRKKMHLSNGDHDLRFGGGGAQKLSEDVIHSDSKTKQPHIKSHNESSGKNNKHEQKYNNVSVAIPPNCSLDAVLDTVLTAWTILIQRYQRDTFHQFTWSIAGDGNDTQCIPTAELDVSAQKTAEALRKRLGSLRPAGHTLSQGSTIIVNDGTSAEVCTGGKSYSPVLTFASGHLRYR